MSKEIRNIEVLIHNGYYLHKCMIYENNYPTNQMVRVLSPTILTNDILLDYVLNEKQR